jgi:1,4-alpha-glucan branching enzyme
MTIKQEPVKQNSGHGKAGSDRKPSLPTGPTPSQAIAKQPNHQDNGTPTKETTAAPRKRRTARAKHAGMGAIPYSRGVAFRVWAPNAGRVFVCGTFNGWAPDATPLANERNGFWSADVPGAKIGDGYKFRIVNGQQELWRIDPYARQVTNSVGEAVVLDPAFDWGDDDFRAPAWNAMTIYEMHIGTFTAGPHGEPGDFDTAAAKLGHLADLGVNTILVMPPSEFPGDISWGYNPSHVFAVESSYGGPLAFKRFVRAAHKHGIAVLLDVVYNHFGPSDLDLWQFDGWSENGMGGIYFYNDWRANTPWGDTRPDYGRNEVRQYIHDNALMWLHDYHCDGLRFDATAYIRNAKGNDNPGDDLPDGWNLLRWINDEINARAPWKITIAEDLRNNEAITAATNEGGAGFNAQWDAGFVHPVREALIAADDVHRNMLAVAGAICNRYNNDAFRRVIYTESHDEVANGKARVPEEVWPQNADSSFAKKRSTLGAGIVFTSPGIPMIFQGQEFLEDGWFDDSKPLDWGKVEKFPGIVELYKELFRLRRNAFGTTKGLVGQYVNVHHVDPASRLIAYHRFAEGPAQEACVVVANFTGQPVENYTLGFPAAGEWKLRFNSDAKVYDPEFTDFPSGDVTAVEEGQDGLPCRAAVGIGPYAMLIYSQDAG